MNYSAEPVEISIRLQDGDWTPESLKELVGSYQQKLQAMGAPENAIETVVKTPDDGSASVHVSWSHQGQQTFADMSQTAVSEAPDARGHGEVIPPGEPTQDSQGLGAILGDAERSAIDEPATDRAVQAGENAVEQAGNDYLIKTGADGKTYVEDVDPAKG
ncbi:MULTISPECIES: hypothetical protein [Arthrobacter]|uniref:hypothetical protein n=1 Tax=Arthrobacter TaxID=1663 RepID=UPI0015C97727|nr:MULTISPECIES: hypothetical protein [Arthrobacter]NYG16197.1 hypothetical protein [Arthrobacter psychrochitiniphilus]